MKVLNSLILQIRVKSLINQFLNGQSSQTKQFKEKEIQPSQTNFTITLKTNASKHYNELQIFS